MTADCSTTSTSSGPLGCCLRCWRSACGGCGSRRSDPLRGWREQIAPELLEALVVGRESAKSGQAPWLLIAWLVAIVAIAGPTWRLEPNPFADDATPLMILLKADVSMMQPDPAPSRLERARLKIADLERSVEGSAARIDRLRRLRASRASADARHRHRRPNGGRNQPGRSCPRPATVSILLCAKRPACSPRANKAAASWWWLMRWTPNPPLWLRCAKMFPTPCSFWPSTVWSRRQAIRCAPAAATLGADVAQLDVEGKDIAAIQRHAASAPVANRGQQGERWQEAGYWLVPLVGLVVLMSFRREEKAEVST